MFALPASKIETRVCLSTARRLFREISRRSFREASGHDAYRPAPAAAAATNTNAFLSASSETPRNGSGGAFSVSSARSLAFSAASDARRSSIIFCFRRDKAMASWSAKNCCSETRDTTFGVAMARRDKSLPEMPRVAGLHGACAGATARHTPDAARRSVLIAVPRALETARRVWLSRAQCGMRIRRFALRSSVDGRRSTVYASNPLSVYYKLHTAQDVGLRPIRHTRKYAASI